MTALWTSAELEAATAGRASAAFVANGVAIDSRTTGTGDLFVALAGPNHDAHDFVGAAAARGAAAAMVHRDVDAPGAPLLRVDDTLEALTRLGVAARARSTARICGITGSVGKTGTKEALRLALAAQGPTHASAASFNNHWGLPLTLARMPRETRFGVLEMGMNHAGELTRLAAVARPHVAVITTVAPAHLGFFVSEEAIADAKAEILSGVEPGGAAILNRDNRHFDRLAAAAAARDLRIVTFGAAAGCDARLVDATLGETESRVEAEILGRRISYILPVAGRHWVINSLAVLAATALLGADPAAGAAALGGLGGLPGRGLRHRVAVPGGEATLIDESYNANPASVAAALAVLGATTPGPGARRIAVLGDMRELGDASGRLHLGLAEELERNHVDLLFAAGSEMARLAASLPPARVGASVATAAELAPVVAGALRPGDVVTVKGSLSMGMAAIVKRILQGGGR